MVWCQETNFAQAKLGLGYIQLEPYQREILHLSKIPLFLGFAMPMTGCSSPAENAAHHVADNMLDIPVKLLLLRL